MKILVREINSEGKLGYVWKQVSKKPKSIENDFIKTVDGKVYSEADILKIKNDYRKSYKYCICCGALIKPGEEEKHFEEQEKRINCFNCQRLHISPTGRMEKVKFSKQDENTYVRDLKQEVVLMCKASGSWSMRTTKEMIEAKGGACPYFRHRYLGVNFFGKTVLMQYPNLNSILATEKSLMDNKFSLEFIEPKERIYHHNKMTKLIAVVDENGIIKNFEYTYRNNRVRFVYSKKYDKIFFIRNGSYYLSGFQYGIGMTTVNNIKNIVAQVYKEEN